MTPADLAVLEAIVRDAACDELLRRFRRIARREKQDGSWLTEADLAMQSRLQAALTGRHPAIALLGEEMALMRGGQIEAGIVYDPVHEVSFAALRGRGATLNGEPLRAA